MPGNFGLKMMPFCAETPKNNNKKSHTQTLKRIHVWLTYFATEKRTSRVRFFKNILNFIIALRHVLVKML